MKSDKYGHSLEREDMQNDNKKVNRHLLEEEFSVHSFM